MASKFSAFHWPDHVIGKRESRRIRDAHNALYNSHAEVLESLKTLVHLRDAAPAATERAWAAAIVLARSRIANTEASE